MEYPWVAIYIPWVTFWMSLGTFFKKNDTTGVPRVCRGCAANSLYALLCKRNAGKYKTWKITFDRLPPKRRGFLIRGFLDTPLYSFQKALVDKHVNFPKKQNECICTIFSISGNVKDLLNPLFLTLGPPDY